MKQEHSEIIDLLSRYLDENPTQRFGQALFNLGINEFKESEPGPNQIYELRDIYNDHDSKILKRMKNRLQTFNHQ